MDKNLSYKILLFIKKNYKKDPYFGICPHDIVTSLPDYPEETIIEHIVLLSKEKYIIGEEWADNYPQSIVGLTSKGNRVVESILL